MIITADTFASLKNKVKNECLRRDKTGDVSEYGSSSYDFLVEATSGNTLSKEHFSKINIPLSTINPDVINNLNPERIVIESEMTAANAFVTLLSQKVDTVSDVTQDDGCKVACTGLCHTTCSGGCVGNCEGGCSGACGSGCSGTCSGTCGSGCSGDCDGGCKGTCETGCSGDCSGTCSGTCDGSCSGCTGGCSQTCTGSCSATCSGGCFTACQEGCATSCATGCRNYSV